MFVDMLRHIKGEVWTKERMPRLFSLGIKLFLFCPSDMQIFLSCICYNNFMFFSRIRSCCFSRVVRDGFFGKFEVEFDGQTNTFPVCIEVLWTCTCKKVF